MNKERLQKLADFLKTVPVENFDLEEWCVIDGGEVTDHIVKAGCETTGCAIGWCASIPEFREAGFHLVVNRSSSSYPNGHAYPRYKGLDGFSAVARFFGIEDFATVDHLFWSGDYPEADRRNPLAVVARIEALIA